MVRACFFDMDRTLVRVNTATLYARWQRRTGAARRRDVARMSWWILRYTFGVIDAEDLARSLARPMRGRDEATFARAIKGWVEDEVLEHITESARREVERRRAEGYLCALLTGSTVYSAEPVARAAGIEHVLCTRLVVDGEGRFTGEIVAPFCFGQGKVEAAEAWAREHDVDLAGSAFYTDSISDLPMLERVGEPVVVNADPRLRWVAWRRRWPVIEW